MYRWMIGFALAVAWALLVLLTADHTAFFHDFFSPDFRVIFLVPALIVLFIFSGVSSKPRISISIMAAVIWFASLHGISLLLPSGLYVQADPLTSCKLLGLLSLHFLAFMLLLRESRGLHEANKRNSN